MHYLKLIEQSVATNNQLLTLVEQLPPAEQAHYAARAASMIRGTSVMLVAHQLQDIASDSVFADAIRWGARTDINECIKMIKMQAEDNYKLVEMIVGKELLTRIINL